MTRSAIERTRARLGTTPRTLTLASLRGDVPPWLNPKDRLFDLWEKRLQIARTGHVTMGAIIMANNLLWSAPGADAGGEVVYSAAPWDEETPVDQLELIAQGCLGLRGKKWIDPDLAAMAAALDAELDRSFAVPVPPVLSFGASVLRGTTFIPRAFLPVGYLTMSILPLFVSPDLPYVLPVPFKLWDPALVDLALDARAWG